MDRVEAGPPIDSEDGVDVSLIRWMLSLTPEERLAVLQGFVDSVLALSASPTSTDAAPAA